MALVDHVRAVALLLALAVAAPGRAAGTEPTRLERPEALAPFFAALQRLETGRAGTVRVLQWGDSHTAADHQSAAVRRALQARFGDAGRGLVFVGRPFASYAPEGIRAGSDGDWRVEQARRPGGERGDGRFGLSGLALASASKGARAWIDAAGPASRLEVAYLKQPRGGHFELLVDGERRARLATRADTAASAWESFALPEGPHALEVRVEGDGEVRVLGATLERTRPGVVWDAAGINGARASVLLEWDEAHLGEQLRRRAPALVVLAYGTNESGEGTGPDAWERQLTAALGRVARAVPDAACLVLGPPDRGQRVEKRWKTLPALLSVVAVQRRVAEAAGCAFYSQLDAMGGEGSIAAWAEARPPRAARDRIHLSKEGYAQLGAALAAELTRAYDEWRVRRPALVRRAGD